MANRKSQESLASRVRRAAPLLLVTALPVLLTTQLWEVVWSGTLVRAWDGTGHYALAQIYDQSIFPDTFGWTHAYFGGMPFPNFYTPVFYWLVAALHHTHLLSFLTSFKLVLSLPVLLMPAAVWTIGWAVSGRDRLAATCAGLAVLPLLVDERFYYPVGLGYGGTFLIGLYTQPLGFVLLVAWYVVYSRASGRARQVVLASLLLALTVLSNFFNAVTAGLFVLTTVAADLLKLYGTADAVEREGLRRTLFGHLVSPVAAFCLAAFWLVPVLSAYDYFVTLPSIVPMNELVPPAAFGWYAVALCGVIIWLRRDREGWPFLAALLALAAAVFFAATVSPRWFPLQTGRFLSTVNFLLAVPAGRALAFGFKGLARALGELKPNNRRARAGRNNVGGITRTPITSAVALLVFLPLGLLLLRQPSYLMAFYNHETEKRIEPVLEFGRSHRDGRFMVEVPPFSAPEVALDGRAINSYLGARGNETLSVVFREASPNSLFFNPQVNALSAFPDSFGISSVLADDLDFFEQPFARHMNRARFMGVKYVVALSPWIKDRISREGGVENRFDFGEWSVFALRGDPTPRASALSYRPALVVSGFSLKQRRRNELDFTRLAEEQFADGWFDVLLARSPESKLDRMGSLAPFGALILNSYECDDEAKCLVRLREFAAERPLILIPGEGPLFRRIKESIADFPHAVLIERDAEGPGPWLAPSAPGFRYNGSGVRRLWEAVRRVLDENRTPVNEAADISFTNRVDQTLIQVAPSKTPGGAVPVLINTTFHPDWRRTDGETIYPVTPFNMLTFTDKALELQYGRRWYESAALWLSALALVCACFFYVRAGARKPHTGRQH